MAAGSFGAHALSYMWAGMHAGSAGGDGDATERSSAGVGAHSVLPVGLLAALAVAAVAVWLVGRARGARRMGVSPWLFFALPLLAFGFQELSERILHAEGAPFHAALEPRFLVGLALQVPFGFAALLAARLLMRVVKGIARALTRARPTLALRRGLTLRPSFACELPRIPALALGYSQRGPPTL